MHRDGELKVRVVGADGERVFRVSRKGKLLVGFKPENHIQLFGKEIPARFPMIESSRNGFRLNVLESMKGEITADDCPLRINDLLKHNLLPQNKHGYALPLTPEKRAVLNFGGLQFFLEYDGRTAEKGQAAVAYWRLSRRLYRRLRSDLLFKSILFVLFLFGGVLGYRLHVAQVKPQNTVNLERYTRHVARLIIRPRQAPPEETIGRRVAAESSEPSAEESGSTSKPASPEESKAKAAEEARKVAMNKGLLGLIAGKGAGNKGSTVIDALVDRGLVRELDELLQSTENLEVELPSVTDIGGNLDELLQGRPKDVEDLVSGMEIDDAVQLDEKGEVSLEQFGDISGSASALGWRSEQSIRDDILKYMGRVQFVYKRFLKIDPELRGKVVMEITIEPEGTVSACRILESTVGNQKFEAELIKVVKSFRFKPIPEGQVIVQNPFVFYRTDI